MRLLAARADASPPLGPYGPRKYPRRKKVEPRPRHKTNASAGRLPRKDAQLVFAGLAELGCGSLADYRATAHWQKLIGDYHRDASNTRACMLCGSIYYVLHHISYERLGCEAPEDLVPLCGEHHAAAHDLLLLRPDGVTLRNAHLRLVASRRAS